MESPNKVTKPVEDLDGFKKQFNPYYNQTEGNRASHFRRNERIDTDGSEMDGKLLMNNNRIFDNNKQLSSVKSELNIDKMVNGIIKNKNHAGSQLCIQEDISARGDAQSRRREQSEDSDQSLGDVNFKTNMIREAEDCEMFKFVKMGKKLGEGAYG